MSIRKPGEPTLTEIRDKYHVTIQKLPGDSAWLVNQYDMHDSLMATGTYKDEKMTIPHGRFFYYAYIESDLRITYDYVHHKSDSVITHPKNHITLSGFYSDGLRMGKWYSYNGHINSVTSISTYVKGKLEGPYQSLGIDNHKPVVVGMYANDMREGKWYMLSPNGDTVQTDIYKKGEIVKSISHMSEKKFINNVKGGYPEYKLQKYLNEKLATANFGKPGIKIHDYSFILNKEGKLIKPNVMRGTPDDIPIDTLIIDALLAAPNWKPALRNNDLVELYIPIQVEVTIHDDKRVFITWKNPLAGKESTKLFNALTDSLIQQ